MAKSKQYLKSSSETCRKAWGIARVSTNRQCDSLEVQERHIKKYCSKHPELNYKDLHHLKESAFSLTPSMLDNIAKQLETGCALIFYKIDRFSRNIDDFGAFKQLIQSNDIEIHFIVEDIVWNKQTDRETLNNIANYIRNAEFESIQISNRVKETNQIMREDGKITFAAPIGYQNYQTGRERGWQIHPVFGPIVKELFELYATGEYSLNDIANIAFNKGVYGKINSNAGKHAKMCKQTIVNMLTNRFYIGEAKYNNQYYKHIYPSLITKDVFNKCQEVLVGKKHRSKNASKELISALSGLVKDEESGKLFSPYVQKGNIYLKSPRNSQKDLKERVLLGGMLQVLKKMSATTEIADMITYYINQNNNADTSLLESELISLQSELKRKQETIDNLLYCPPSSATQEQLDRNIKKLNADIINIEQKIPTIQAQIQDAKSKFINVEQNLVSSYQALNCQTQNKILKILFSSINFRGNQITFVINEDFREILKKQTYIRQYIK